MIEVKDGAKSVLKWLLTTVLVGAVPMYLFGLGCFWYVVSNQGVYRIQVDNMREDWEMVNGRLLELEQFHQDQQLFNQWAEETLTALKLWQSDSSNDQEASLHPASSFAVHTTPLDAVQTSDHRQYD